MTERSIPTMRNNIHTREIFERAYKGRTWHWYEWMLDLKGLREPILDVGCGLGFFVECCQKKGLDCIGIDASGYAVDVAKKKKLRVLQYNLSEPLPFKDSSFNTVMCYQVIEHLTPNTAEFMLREAHRVLSAEGKIFVFSPSKYDTKEHKEETHIDLYTPYTLKKQLELAGFRNIKFMNQPLPILGDNFMNTYIFKLIFKLYQFDRLSKTANCIGGK